MTSTNEDEKLNQILKKSQTLSEVKLLPDEITSLTSVFLPTRPDTATIKSKGYIVLSAFCQRIRDLKGKGKETDTPTAAHVFGPIVFEYLGETNESSLLTGMSFLTALFQVDAAAASSIFTEDGVVENVMDTVDLSPSSLLCEEVAHLLGQACGHKICRSILTPQIVRWLEFKSRQTSDAILLSAASVALIKFSKGSVSDDPENGTPHLSNEQTDELVEKLVDIILSDQNTSHSDAVEGLAYLTTDAHVKEKLSRNPSFLAKLFSLIPVQKNATKKISMSAVTNPTVIFGVIFIISNLTSFRPRLSEEQRQVQKLKKMAKAGKGSAETDNTLDDDAHVKARIRLLIASGLLPVFAAALAVTESDAVRINIGNCLLAIAEEKENRGNLLQTGGAKVLISIINQGLPTHSNDNSTLDAAYLVPIQALAKLAITSSPVQVFGPNVGALFDTIRPFCILLQHPSSNPLQHFESLMALTNLASVGQEVASRIAKADGLLNKVELLLFENHVLTRRAAVELLCNLIGGSTEAFDKYSGNSPNSINKIHILLAMSDVNDLPTRLAASGALATITLAPAACTALIELQFEKGRFLPLMTQLVDPSAVPEEKDEEPLETNPGLVHRGLVCVDNVVKTITDGELKKRLIKEATESGLMGALSALVKHGTDNDATLVNLAASILKVLA